MRISSKRLIATAVTATLTLAACGGGDDTTDAPAGDATDGGPAAGSVFVSGSSTVEPISIRVAEPAATTAGGAPAVTGEGPGAGDGT